MSIALFVCVCMRTFTRSLTMAIFVFCHLSMVIALPWCFCKSVLAKKCFIFKEIHGEDPDKYYRMQVSDNFKIITLNWIRIPKTLMENWWIHKSANKRSRRKKDNYMGLSELMRMIIIFVTFCLNKKNVIKKCNFKDLHSIS